MRVLITGAASGLGRATCERLRGSGHQAVGIDRQPSDGTLIADVRDAGQVADAIASAVEKMGGIDVLINCAGVGAPSATTTTPTEAERAIVETNLFGAWNVTAACIPHLLESQGRVVNVASGLAFVTLPYSGAYTASKRALSAYSDVLRAECRGAIQVSTVYPGYVATPIHETSLRAGIDLGAAVPHDKIDQVARVIASSATGRYRRDVSTSFLTAVGVWMGRHMPWLMDKVVEARAGSAFRGEPFTGG